MPNKRKSITMVLEPELRERIVAILLAQRKGDVQKMDTSHNRTMSSVLRDLVLAGLDKFEHDNAEWI